MGRVLGRSGIEVSEVGFGCWAIGGPAISDGIPDGDGDISPVNPGKIGLYVRSSHLSGKIPTGDNMGMLDGSAKWRKFAVMMPRTVPEGIITFWW